MFLQCSKPFYSKVSSGFVGQDSHSSYSFGKIQNVAKHPNFLEKKFSVSLEKDQNIYIKNKTFMFLLEIELSKASKKPKYNSKRNIYVFMFWAPYNMIYIMWIHIYRYNMYYIYYIYVFIYV